MQQHHQQESSGNAMIITDPQSLQLPIPEERSYGAISLTPRLAEAEWWLPKWYSGNSFFANELSGLNALPIINQNNCSVGKRGDTCDPSENPVTVL